MKFDGLNSSNFTLAKYLARENEVYYIEDPITFKDYLKMDRSSDEYQTRKQAYKLLSLGGVLKEKFDNVNIVVPSPVFPVNFLPAGLIYEFFLKLNQKIVRKSVRKILKSKNIQSYIYINAYNFNLPELFKGLSPKLSLYYCVDPIPHYSRKHGLNNEMQLVKHSDIVVCTSKSLFEEKKLHHENTYFVPNGSDLINDIAKNKIKTSNLLKDIARPIVGYIGAIERRIDYNLLNRVIALNKMVSFVFIGPIYYGSIPDGFFDQENVHVFEPIMYADLPSVIDAFDICMIPFKKDEISSAIFPLKLFEYLGVGKPVIATDFNMDLAEYTLDTVTFVKDEFEFSDAISKFKVDDPKLVEARKEVARKNTWSHRVTEIEKIMSKYL